MEMEEIEPDELDEPVEVHQQMGTYPCHKCDPSTMMSLPELRRHNLTQHKRWKVNCSRCLNVFPSEKMLKQHQMSVHGIPLPIVATYTCSHCRKHMSKEYTAPQMEQHNKNFHKGYTEKCWSCLNVFQKGKLATHTC